MDCFLESLSVAMSCGVVLGLLLLAAVLGFGIAGELGLIAPIGNEKPNRRWLERQRGYNLPNMPNRTPAQIIRFLCHEYAACRKNERYFKAKGYSAEAHQYRMWAGYLRIAIVDLKRGRTK